MARYRKLPVEVEAVQLTWPNWSEVCDFADVGRLKNGNPEGCYVLPDGEDVDGFAEGARLGLRIPTLEGLMLATEGDFIIRGVNGELYPCKPDIFEKTYEAVTE